MTRTRIKICGITRLADAIFCSKIGIDAIGLVFYPPSPRSIEVDQARLILKDLPPFISVVGLFMDPDPQWVFQVLKAMPLDVLQFHGQETGDFCRYFSQPYIKAIAMNDSPQDFDAICYEYRHAQAFLLDANKNGEAGGQGVTFDWSLVPTTLKKPLVLAGGLRPDNIKVATDIIRPYAVDCSSGVESAPGIKDHIKISQFAKNVRDIDAQI